MPAKPKSKQTPAPRNKGAGGGRRPSPCSAIFEKIAGLSIDYTGYEITVGQDPETIEEICEAIRRFRIDRENETDRQLCLFEAAAREILSQNAEHIRPDTTPHDHE